MLVPNRSECVPRTQDRLSTNSKARFLFVYGPSVLSPNVLNPLIGISGIPQASGGGSTSPGIFSAATTSRANASSRPNVLKKSLSPQRNSLSTEDERISVL